MEDWQLEQESKPNIALAFHEAGHLVAAYRLGIPFTGREAVAILPSKGDAGVSIQRNIVCGANLEPDVSDQSRLKMERLVQVCLGGIEAQRRQDPSSVRYGEEDFGDGDGGLDYGEAVELIGFFASGPKEPKAYLKLLRIRTEYLIAGRNWDCVEAVAEALDRKSGV